MIQPSLTDEIEKTWHGFGGESLNAEHKSVEVNF